MGLAAAKAELRVARADSDVTAASLGDLLLRTAECLAALLQSPTARAGLNEARYNVLAVLQRAESAGCSQSELARDLLQSESNLSTLLERMRKDGLISRVRSETDRRKALIGLTPAGSEALEIAQEARARATAALLNVLGEHAEPLSESLGLLVDRLEDALGVAGRATFRRRAAGISLRPGPIESQTTDDPPAPAALSMSIVPNPAESSRRTA